jgi:hypothetical protein
MASTMEHNPVWNTASPQKHLIYKGDTRNSAIPLQWCRSSCNFLLCSTLDIRVFVIQSNAHVTTYGTAASPNGRSGEWFLFESANSYYPIRFRSLCMFIKGIHDVWLLTLQYWWTSLVYILKYLYFGKYYFQVNKIEW